MSPVRLIILLVAAGAAIAAVFLVRSIQSPSKASASAVAERVQVPTKQVLVAKRDIPVGKMVVVDDLRWQDWPENSPSKSFIEQKAEPEALQNMVGAVARVSLAEGEPLTLAKMVHTGDAGFMSALLSPGMRAVSLEIRPENAAGGFIQPNDRVDVMVTREIESDGKRSSGLSAVRTDLILANIRVLAIDANYAPPAVAGEEGGAQGAAMVGSRATLEMSPADATLVGSAQKAGDISLSLRSISDQLDQTVGATPTGRVYRDGVAQDAEGVRVYRYGSEAVVSTPAS